MLYHGRDNRYRAFNTWDWKGTKEDALGTNCCDETDEAHMQSAGEDVWPEVNGWNERIGLWTELDVAPQHLHN